MLIGKARIWVALSMICALGLPRQAKSAGFSLRDLFKNAFIHVATTEKIGEMEARASTWKTGRFVVTDLQSCAEDENCSKASVLVLVTDRSKLAKDENGVLSCRRRALTPSSLDVPRNEPWCVLFNRQNINVLDTQESAK